MRAASLSVLGLLLASVLGTNGAGAATVRVAPGETLTHIAATYGTSVDALVAANGIGDPDVIEAGTVLVVPASTSVSSDEASGAAGGSGIITVRPGDTLSDIASRYGTTVTFVADSNGITDPSHIEIGSKLVVPGASDESAPSGGAGLLSTQVHRTSLPAGLLTYPGRLTLRPLFQRWASDFGVPVPLLEAMCWWESGWQMSAVSSTGAVGIGQLEPWTVAQLRISLRQPRLKATNTSDNIEMAAAYLHQLLVQTGGDQGLALAGYYQGIPSVQQRGMFPSTVQYVQGILAFARLFG